MIVAETARAARLAIAQTTGTQSTIVVAEATFSVVEATDAHRAFRVPATTIPMVWATDAHRSTTETLSPPLREGAVHLGKLTADRVTDTLAPGAIEVVGTEAPVIVATNTGDVVRQDHVAAGAARRRVLAKEGDVKAQPAALVTLHRCPTGNVVVHHVQVCGLAEGGNLAGENRPRGARIGLESNEQPVKDYLDGRGNAVGFLVGQVMKETRGRANPQLVNRLLEETLKSKKRGS